MKAEYLKALGCRALLKGSIFLIKAMFYVFVLATALAVGPIIEGKLYPVITPSTDALVSYKDNYMLVSLSGIKNRACQIVSVIALSKVNGVFVQTKITFLDTGTEVSNPEPRPAGLQYFGPYKIEPQGTAVRIVTEHQCHPLWITETPLVTWDSDDIKIGKQ